MVTNPCWYWMMVRTRRLFVFFVLFFVFADLSFVLFFILGFSNRLCYKKQFHFHRGVSCLLSQRFSPPFFTRSHLRNLLCCSVFQQPHSAHFFLWFFLVLLRRAVTEQSLSRCKNPWRPFQELHLL